MKDKIHLFLNSLSVMYALCKNLRTIQTLKGSKYNMRNGITLHLLGMLKHVQNRFNVYEVHNFIF